MFHYKPPKSQLWGHQVGRLRATAVVNRALRFLETHCTIIQSQPSELMIGWNSGPHAHLAEDIVANVDQTLGSPTVVDKLPKADGRLFQYRRWQFSAERLPLVATWLDQLADVLSTPDVVAHSSTFWMFAWRDEPTPLRPLESAGGMLGIHLGLPHRITTMFSFRDLQRYASIKTALSELELVELSDKHLRPKVGTLPAKRK